VVISNHKFAHHFDAWAASKKQKITVVDDGTDTNETRLGAVCDIQFAIEKLSLDDDMLVIAGDNVLDFSLTKFIEYANQKGASAILRYYEPEIKKLLKSGVVTVDESDLVLEMTEKSPTPATNWCCPPFYFYSKEDARLVKEGISAGCGTDAPGSYIAWLCKKSRVYAMQMPGKRYDIGNLESYEQVKRDYRGITNA
jgi:glucose-1-phosphate thymidylyltransferase